MNSQSAPTALGRYEGAFASLWIAVLRHQLLSSSSSGSLDAYLINADARGLARFLHGKIEDDRFGDRNGLQCRQRADRTALESLRGSKASRARNEQLDDLRAIVGLFLRSGVMYPEEIGRWLRSRIAELNYARPYVLLGKGRFDQSQDCRRASSATSRGPKCSPPSLDDDDWNSCLRHPARKTRLMKPAGSGKVST